MEPMTRFRTAVAAFDTSPSEYTFDAAMAAKEAAYADFCALRDEYNRLAVEFVSERGDVVIGDSRFYVGTVRSYKPRHDADTTASLMLAYCGGDMESLCSCLASGCWKPGTVRTTVGDDAFAELFETVEAEDVKTGKPKKEVKKAFENAGKGQVQ